jgi:pyrophosphatase PpaX
MAMPAPRRFPAVLFDLDGTLIDSLELILNSARYAFAKLERAAPPDEEWLAGVGIPLFTMFARYARDIADRDALIVAYREYQMANHDRLVRCYDGVVDAVRTLHERGYELGIVTSKSDALAMRGLAHVGLAKYMDTIVGCDSSSRHKPDPEPVRIALQRLGYAPEDAIFVGDSIFDIQAGNAAGVKTIAVLWGAAKKEEFHSVLPSAYAASSSELVAMVERWSGGTVER